MIDYSFPDPANRRPAAARLQAMRWHIASLIVVFPVFLYMARYIARAVVVDPALRASTIGRQLAYLTMFIAAAMLTGDLITVVFFALGGDLTVKFILKVLTIAAIAGAFFGFSRWMMRRDETEAPA